MRRGARRRPRPILFPTTSASSRSEPLMASSPPPAAWPAVSPNDFALLQFTGATTGVPKAAMLTHDDLTAAVSSYLAWVDGQRQPDAAPERVVMVLPLFHIYGLTSVLL